MRTRYPIGTANLAGFWSLSFVPLRSPAATTVANTDFTSANLFDDSFFSSHPLRRPRFTKPTAGPFAMSTPDSNTWYRIENQDTGTAGLTAGTITATSTADSVFLLGDSTTEAGSNQYWQFFPAYDSAGASYYIIRTEYTGPGWVLRTYSNCDGVCDPVPNIDTTYDNTVYWSWTPYPDQANAFSLTNAGNGTGYYLEKDAPNQPVTQDNLLRLAAFNSTDSSQRWSISSIAEINNSSFSTVSSTITSVILLHSTHH